MRKFEYESVVIERRNPLFEKGYPMTQLQQLGRDGWEVVSIVDKFDTNYGYGTETKEYYWHVLLKREIE